MLKLLRRESPGAASVAPASAWPAAGACILPLADIRSSLAALAQLPADATGAAAAQPLAAAAAALAHLIVLLYRHESSNPGTNHRRLRAAAEMVALVCERSGFLQHLPDLLSLAGRGFIVVEEAIRASVHLTSLFMMVQPEGPAAAALRLPGAALQAMVQLIASGAPEAAAAPADGATSDTYSLTLIGIADNAITCLLKSCIVGGGLEHVIAACGLRLQEPEVLRRLVRLPEGPLPTQAIAARVGFLVYLAKGAEGGSSASPQLVALRRSAGEDALEFCLAGVRNKLAPEPVVAAGGSRAENQARRAAVAAVSGGMTDPSSPSMTMWFGLLGAIISVKSSQPGDEAIRVRLVRLAVDRGAHALVLTALEAASLVPGPEGVNPGFVSNGLSLLSSLVKTDERCWREAVLENAPPASAISARRPAWAAAAGGEAGRVPPWTVSVAVGVLKTGRGSAGCAGVGVFRVQRGRGPRRYQRPAELGPR